MTQIASQISKCLRICRSPKNRSSCWYCVTRFVGGHSQMGKLGWAASTIRKHMWQHRLAHRGLLQYKMSQKKRNLVKVVQNPCSNFHKSVFFRPFIFHMDAPFICQITRVNNHKNWVWYGQDSWEKINRILSFYHKEIYDMSTSAGWNPLTKKLQSHTLS